VSEPEPSRPGSILRAEREALGVTVREVSETLNLSITVIEAIEADDHEHLPGPVFARGYVRAYARLLELEPGPLIAQYPPPESHLVAVESAPELPIWEWIRRRPALVLGAAGAALLLLLALVVVWAWPGGEGERLEDGVTAADSTVPSQPWSEPTTARAAGTADASSPDEVSAGELADIRNADQLDADAADGDSTTTPEGNGAVRRITETGDDHLAFAFSDDCWVEVRNAGGSTLYSDLGRSGSRLVLVGEGPFRILLGYAPGVQLTFNDEPMPLAPHTRNNVATLVLGQ
jgi:cytoskeleton protein RodZ